MAPRICGQSKRLGLMGIWSDCAQMLVVIWGMPQCAGGHHLLDLSPRHPGSLPLCSPAKTTPARSIPQIIRIVFIVRTLHAVCRGPGSV